MGPLGTHAHGHMTSREMFTNLLSYDTITKYLRLGLGYVTKRYKVFSCIGWLHVTVALGWGAATSHHCLWLLRSRWL